MSAVMRQLIKFAPPPHKAPNSSIRENDLRGKLMDGCLGSNEAHPEIYPRWLRVEPIRDVE
jgi:hypothetical protein